MTHRSDAKARPATRPHEPGAKPDPVADVPILAEGEVDHRDSTGGPGSVGWWLDDSPGSPIAADIEEPEKRL